MVLPIINFPDVHVPTKVPYVEGMRQVEDVENERAHTQDILNRNTPDMLHNKLLSMQLANQLKQIQAKYAEPNAQQALLSAQLANQLSQIKNKYAEPRERAGLLSTQLANQRAQATLPYAGRRAAADTDLAEFNARIAPLKQMLDVQKSTQANTRFGPSYQLSKFLSTLDPATKADYILQHQDAYNQMMNDLGNGALQSQNNTISPEIIKKYLPDYNASAPLPPPGSNTNPLNVNAPNQPPPRPSFETTSDQAERMGDLMRLQVNRKSVTAPIWTRAESAAALDKFALDNREQYAPRLANVAKYAGLAGRSALGWAAVKKESPQAYQDYRWFKDSFAPMMVNHYKQMEKLGSTDKQREEMHSAVEGLSRIDLDSKSGIKLFNRQLKTLSQLGSSVMRAAQPVYPDAMKKSYGLKDFPDDYVSDDIGIVRVRAPNGSIIRGTPEQINRLIKDHPDHKRLD